MAYRDGRTALPVAPAAEEADVVLDDLSLLPPPPPPLVPSVEEVGPRRSDWNTESMVKYITTFNVYPTRACSSVFARILSEDASSLLWRERKRAMRARALRSPTLLHEFPR